MVNFDEVLRALLAKYPVLTSTLVPLGSFQIFKVCQMLKGEWGTESNGKLSHPSIPSETAAWVPEFAVEDLPLNRTVALVPEFAVKDLPLGKYSDDDDITCIPCES